MRRSSQHFQVAVLFLGLAVAGCSSTQPVSVVTKRGEVMRGTATTATSGGSFHVTNGTVACDGIYARDRDWLSEDPNALAEHVTLNGHVACSDGRTGATAVMVGTDDDLHARDISGRMWLNDGTEVDLVFGERARAN